MSEFSFATLFGAVGDIIDAILDLMSGESDFGETGFAIGTAMDVIYDEIENILDGPD